MNIINAATTYVENLLAPLEGLDYHRFKHTSEVHARAKYLALKEGISEEDLEILELAALFHDTGFIVSYDENEGFGTKISRNFLITHHYPEEKISQISELIMATTHSYTTPKNLCEQIIKDADMDNLGRDDFHEKMQHIKTERELVEGETISNDDWQVRCRDMLKNYQYFTKTQQEERNETKQKNLNSLESLLK